MAAPPLALLALLLLPPWAPGALPALALVLVPPLPPHPARSVAATATAAPRPIIDPRVVVFIPNLP
jgi:hypothetical protein